MKLLEKGPGFKSGLADLPKHLNGSTISAGLISTVFGCTGPCLVTVAAASAAGARSSARPELASASAFPRRLRSSPCTIDYTILLIPLQRIYNFLLFHAIILSVLDVYGFIKHFYIIFWD